MLLPFGKYKNLDTADPDIPVTYLAWLEEQDWIERKLREDLNAELKRRRGDRAGAGKVVRKGAAA